MKITDKNGVPIENGSIIDIHQTVNGQNKFVVINAYNLDIRYAYDISRRYEYSHAELLDINTHEKTFEVIGNIRNVL